MNCKPGDLAYIVKAPLGGPIGVVVEVTSEYQDGSMFGRLWRCTVREPVITVGAGAICDPFIADDWLRPISGVPLDDETPVAVNLPEAFKLALGIEMRAWA